jgi:hypothetical protein
MESMSFLAGDRQATPSTIIHSLFEMSLDTCQRFADPSINSTREAQVTEVFALSGQPLPALNPTPGPDCRGTVAP